MTPSRQLLLPNLTQTLGKDTRNGDKKFCQEGVILLLDRATDTNNFAHSTKWEEEKGNEMHYRVSSGDYCAVRDGVVFVEPKQDLMKRRHGMKKNCAYTEIQYRLMFTRRASGQHCIDCNECELAHSDGKTRELNKGQIREVMHVGCCYYRFE